MSPQIFSIVDIVGAGRGVIATEKLAKDQLILRSEPPAAHVIFHQYRKEVCATCFHYDRGRTLPVRLNNYGKVFCSAACEEQWLNDQGSLGLEAWEQFQLFLKVKSKAISNAAGLPLLAPKPNTPEILDKWRVAEDTAKQVQKQRKRLQANNKGGSFNQFISKPWCQAVDPDILSYLLSGILFHYNHPQQYTSTILPLAMDTTPYRSTLDLNGHCNSYIQLCAILPATLQSSCTPSVCQELINAASHNSFGIRSGSADGDEYLGYGLFPDASYFNHSCAPNVRKERVGGMWEFCASREVEEGEELCITYLGGDEDELNVQQRRQRLKEHWSFECQCTRCRDESNACAS